MTEVANNNNNLFLCYNKGCGKMFDSAVNGPESCQFHPGIPVFHDALKGWSCCNKKSTDFTQFLSIPGCTRSSHSNLKPPEPVKPEKPKEDPVVAMINSLENRKKPEPTPRPTADEPLVELKRTVAPSLTAALEKLVEATKNLAVGDSNNQLVPTGTPCKNASCQATFQGESSNHEKCVYHPGTAVFHEGMKYWSCCDRKTSDFNSFLNQVGCAEGTHLWFKNQTEKVNCRFDFHQAAGNFAIVTFYSKNPLPDKTTIKANKIRLEVNISFEGGSKTFEQNFDLFGVIKLEESKVEFFQSKVEIKLKKADPISWSKLEYMPPKN